MKYLETQEQFETLIGRIPSEEPVPSSVIIQFSAVWCGPCRRLDMDRIIGSTAKHITWLKCDVDMNSYTAGFCGIRSIPSFLAIQDKKVIAQIQASDTEKVISWANDLFRGNK